MDIGPKTSEIFTKIIYKAKTLLWNGPPGVFEIDAFSKGTQAMLEAFNIATKLRSTTIIGKIKFKF